MVGKLRMARNVADDCGNPDFVIIARTDGLSAVEAPESLRQMDLAVERGLRYLDTGIPDLLWCEFPTSDRKPLETFTEQIQKRFPKARFAFNWSSSFKWYNDPDPIRFAELGRMGVKFIFITLGGQHATGYGLSNLLQAMSENQEQGYIELQREEWAQGKDYPTRSHHFFSGVPYHHLVGKMHDASRLGQEFVEDLPAEKVV
jgi:isocitrate lyase